MHEKLSLTVGHLSSGGRESVSFTIFAAGWHSMVATISSAKAVLRFEIGIAFCGIASHTLMQTAVKATRVASGGAGS
ncbi:hypothetical protein [Mesorhizobium sp. LSHC414A00]|uniref:hypothetical protein n=1 Tax=Mesorhizobium sp. LSHC414A00 TaxID=1287287 RepID=UPI0012EBF9A0|nr:hypothetical protein [Mesorhizobium sp. LSHC414A00]